jgi:hypothetical protein
MSSKAELIAKMLEMQTKFSEATKDGIDITEYFGETGDLPDHIVEYNKIAAEVNRMAHEEAGSHS